MSSIISDIFYNSKNNALLDNYLLNRNVNYNQSQTQSAIIPQLDFQ
jgi:hypothetical protein